MIISGEQEKPENIMRDLKGFTSKHILQAIIDNQRETVLATA